MKFKSSYYNFVSFIKGLVAAERHHRHHHLPSSPPPRLPNQHCFDSSTAAGGLPMYIDLDL